MYYETEGDLVIVFTPETEYKDMESHFRNECGWTARQYQDIEDCAWFCAKVAVYHGDKELATEYIGCCCYERIEDFYTKYKDEYYAQMKDDALRVAHETLRARAI